ncbi:MAG TPA: hypothetical protein VKR52_07820 [Terracidiphilus sp.]|nr:hypothetical protein [Terracidiphilus sp.]
MNRRNSPSVGLYIFSLASIVTGVLDLVWHEFEPAHEPLQAYGDNIPGRTICAIIVACCLVAAGAAILSRKTARYGAVALGIIFCLFAVFWLPRFYWVTVYRGVHIGNFIGVFGGVCQQLFLAGGAMLVYAANEPAGSPARANAFRRGLWIIGFSSVDFGLMHLTGIQPAADFVPKWIPLGGTFWAIVTGILFLLAGLAILTGIRDVLAAWLLGLMLLLFSALILTPMTFAAPYDHTSWGGNFYNLTAVGAAWMLAEQLALRRKAVES